MACNGVTIIRYFLRFKYGLLINVKISHCFYSIFVCFMKRWANAFVSFSFVGHDEWFYLCLCDRVTYAHRLAKACFLC